MAGVSLHGVVEAVYRLTVPRSTWLEGMARAVEGSLGQELGTCAFLVDAADSKSPRVIDYSATRSIAGLDAVVGEAFANLEPTYTERARSLTVSHTSDHDGMAQPGLRLWLDAFGARDMLAILGIGATGTGVVLTINLAERREEDARRSRTLEQIAAHVLGAYDLRAEPAAAHDAVFRSDGVVVEANDDVHEARALRDLENAVRALGALHNTRSDATRAFDAFTSRVDATWSVVARVEDGDDGWIVAKKNPPAVLPLPDHLTLRERQVMTLLLLGRSQKVVAYELGIAHSTVRVLVSRTLAKVGAKSVEELRARSK